MTDKSGRDDGASKILENRKAFIESVILRKEEQLISESFAIVVQISENYVSALADLSEMLNVEPADIGMNDAARASMRLASAAMVFELRRKG